MLMLNDSKFIKRTLSAIILAPIVLGVIFYGGLAFQIFVGIILGFSISEWWRMSLLTNKKILFGIFGSIYIGLCVGAFYGLRIIPEYSDEYLKGSELVFCVLLMVWAGDIGAYFFGKFIGGPKMAPRFSPNKTLSGLIGGMLMGGLVFYGSVYYLMPYVPYFMDVYNNISGFWFFVYGALMGVVGQVGDVSISAMKRYVGVKDTGNVIPGHGGILDRIDALLLVSLVTLISYYWLVEGING